MNNFKRASISVVVVLGIGIMVMSLNRQSDTIGVGASAPVVSTEINSTSDLTQTNSRLTDVENNLSQITSTQQTMLNSIQELIKISKQSKQNAMTSTESLNSQTSTKNVATAPPTAQEIAEQVVEGNQKFAQKESYFYDEPVDEAWRSNEESKLNSIFEEKQLSASNLECRGGSCRVELAAVNLTEANDELDKLVLALPNADGEFKQVEQADGSFKTIMIIKPGSN